TRVTAQLYAAVTLSARCVERARALLVPGRVCPGTGLSRRLSGIAVLSLTFSEARNAKPRFGRTSLTAGELDIKRKRHGNHAPLVPTPRAFNAAIVSGRASRAAHQTSVEYPWQCRLRRTPFAATGRIGSGRTIVDHRW